MSSVSSGSSSPSPTPSPSKHARKRKSPILVEDSDSNDDSDGGSDSSGEDEDEDTTTASPEVEAIALSHAERRRQKKKEKLLSVAAETSPKKKLKLSDGTAVATSTAQGKRKNSVWVGNMSFRTTPENLRTFFEGVGEITRIHMPMKAAPAGKPGVKPENRGFAYVDFETEAAKKNAIGRSEQPLAGRKLLIKDGDDFSGRPAVPGVVSTDPISGAAVPRTLSKTAQKILRAQKQPPAPTLFLGNLGFETTDAAIRELFEAHHKVPKKDKAVTVRVVEASDHEEEGEGVIKKRPDQKTDVWIRKVRMGTFEDSGLCKGFAFVDFMTTEDATSALINPKNHTLNGRKLVVEYAGVDAVRRGAPKAKREEGTVPRSHVPRDRPRFDKRPVRSFPTRREEEERVEPEDAFPQVSEPQQRRDVARPDAVRGKGPRVRPKPGAALAMAKRESAAIIPSQGKKIIF